MTGVTSNPKINVQLLPAAVVDAFEDRRDLIIGQVGLTGESISENTLYRNVHTKTVDEIRYLAGDNSELSYRIFMWIQGNGRYSPLDVIMAPYEADEDGSSGTIIVSGTADASGFVTVSVVDEKRFTVRVPVPANSSSSTIAGLIESALDNLSYPVFNASVSTDTVTLTANDIGDVGDKYGIKVVNDVPGISFAITQFSGGGSTSGDIEDVFDLVPNTRYTGVSWPEYYDIDIAESEFDDRFNVDNGIMDGVVFLGISDTFANNLDDVSGYNSPSLVWCGNDFLSVDIDQRGPAVLQPADWVLAYFMGVRSRRLTPGAPVADFVIATGGPLDAIGGPHNASLPYFNTPLAETPVTLPANLYTTTEQAELEDAGFATFGVNPAGNEMIMGAVPTTWKTDAAGNENVSFHYLNYVDTGSVCREVFFRTLRSTYVQSRLTEGDLIPGYSMANAESIKSTLLRIYRTLANQALLQAGREAESYFSANTTVTVNLADRKVDIAGPLPIVTQLGIINYALQFSFTVGQTGTQITF